MDLFRFTVGRVLADAYGPDYGAYMSFQAFGERAFGKWHPHLDFTLNGWMPADGGAEQTRTYDLRAGGYRRWEKRTREHASALFLLDESEIHTNLNIQHFTVGAPAYYRALLYQVRELVDVRKMEYDRARQLVWWHSYRDNQRERMTVQQFHDGLATYQAVVGAWGQHQTRRLHVGVGHLADNRLDATQTQVGGAERAHKRNCHCAQCDDWGEPLFPDDEGNYEFDPWKPMVNLAVAA